MVFMAEEQRSFEFMEVLEQQELERKRLMSFIPTHFIICGLPLRTKKELEFTREYNGNKLRLVSGKGVPGGRIARLIMTLFTTEAVLRKNSNFGEKIELTYDSIKQFMKAIGMERSNHQEKVLDLLERFAECNIFFEAKRERAYKKANTLPAT